jgi:hypothetical protein
MRSRPRGFVVRLSEATARYVGLGPASVVNVLGAAPSLAALVVT